MQPTPKLKIVLYYGFDHEKVAEKFEGNLSFCAEFCVNGEYKPVAVYKAKTPNKSKGHKKYMLLQKNYEGGIVRGMDQEEIDKWRYQDAVHCKVCNLILYSIYRHHDNSCDCKEEGVSIDGGKDYTKISYTECSDYERVTLDLLTGKIKK